MRLATSTLDTLRLKTPQTRRTPLGLTHLALAALILLPLARLVPAPDLSAESSPAPELAVVMLGVFGAGLAYVLFWRVIRSAGAVVATTVTYAIPVVSTAAGVLILDEPLLWHQPVGAVIVLAGVSLTQAPKGS